MDYLLQELFSAYQAAAAISGVSIVTLSIGGHHAYLSFASQHLERAFLQSLAGLVVSEDAESASLKIYLWDASCGKNFISKELQQQLQKASNATTVLNTENVHFQLNHESKTITYIDMQKRIAFYFTADTNALPDYEICCPMRIIMHYFCKINKMLLVHAAGVGWNGKGVLLIGRGGSGKSTTALISLLNGFDFIGDDYLAISTVGRRVGYPIYRGCKLMDSALQKLPQLAPYVIKTNRTGEKNVVIVDETLGQLTPSLTIDHIIHPKVTNATTSTFEKLPMMKLLAEFATSTILQIPGKRSDMFDELTKFSREIPANFMFLSDHFIEIATTLKRFLDGEIASPFVHRESTNEYS